MKLVVPALVSVALAAAAPSTTIVAKVRTGMQPCATVGYRGFLYVANYRSNTIAKVDPATNRVVRRLSVGLQPCGLLVLVDDPREP